MYMLLSTFVKIRKQFEEKGPPLPSCGLRNQTLVVRLTDKGLSQPSHLGLHFSPSTPAH